MRFFYTLIILLYRLGIAIVSPFSDKARVWQRRRRGEFAKLAATFDGNERPIWIHSASLGEYEQAKPLIERIKKEQPHTKVLVTFFSPSGYEVCQNDPLLDYLFYLPLDLPQHARRFIQIVQPQAAIFVKYEFWFNYLHELSQQKIPFYYICAIFRPTQYFFKPIGGWFAKQLQQTQHLFVQNEESYNLLKTIHIEQVTICGDTRFDRVYALASQPCELDFVTQFQQGQKLIVAGSSWAPDEQLLAQVLRKLKGYKLLIAPHEISRKEEVAHTFNSFKTLCYTEMGSQNLADYDVLILDTIGMLSKLYRYSTFSYVGGAFKTGLHNILEAAVYGVPLFFGPQYRHYNEAIMLVERKGAFPVERTEQMLGIVRQFAQKPNLYTQTCAICRDYVRENLGAVDKIYNTLYVK